MSDAPTWQPDSAAAACFLCSTPYTLFNRRHHCRKCGRVVCAACSGQNIKYFSNAQVLHGDGPPLRAQPHESYRTCDECVDEIRMIRRALFGRAEPVDEPAAPPLPAPLERHSHLLGTKYATRVGTRHLDLLLTLLLPPADARSDDNLCPVCGADLLQLYVRHTRELGLELSHDAYEVFKEAHVGDCLVAFDFNLDHLRLASPPNHARNRMLVYNIPPIPRPSYETIDVAQSVDTIQDEVCGLVTSNLTVRVEKDLQDSECVICLEDLKPGDKVGRLECLCVFHYKCIKDWFNKKGYGECPVHFLHH